MVLVVGHCLRHCVPRCLRTNSKTIIASSVETSSSEKVLEGGSCGVRRRRSSSASAARQSSGISSDDDESFINFTLIGPPGSGKGTYGSIVADKLGVQFVSMGDVLRRHVKHETDIGKAVQTYKHRGKLVPDDIAVSALRQEELNWWQRTKEIQQNQDKEPNATSKVGFILDGFPRTVAQAKLISPSLSMGSPLSSDLNVSDVDGRIDTLPFRIHYAIHIDVPLNICLKKIMGRRTCSKCGRSINTCDIRPEVDDGFCMPPMLPPITTTDATADETCSPHKCSKYWSQRADDTQQNVVQHRLEEYHVETSPVLDYYKSMNGSLLSFKPYNGLKDVQLLTNLIMQNAGA